MYVYAVNFENYPEVTKIGLSTQPESRFKQLRRIYGRIKSVVVFKGERYKLAERYLHAVYKDSQSIIPNLEGGTEFFKGVFFKDVSQHLKHLAMNFQIDYSFNYNLSIQNNISIEKVKSVKPYIENFEKHVKSVHQLIEMFDKDLVFMTSAEQILIKDLNFDYENLNLFFETPKSSIYCFPFFQNSTVIHLFNQIVLDLDLLSPNEGEEIFREEFPFEYKSLQKLHLKLYRCIIDSYRNNAEQYNEIYETSRQHLKVA